MKIHYDMTVSVDVKRCDCCGKDTPIIETGDVLGITGYKVVCPTCFKHTGMYDNLHQAVKTWNNNNL